MCSAGLAVSVFCALASSRSRSIEYSPPPFFSSASGFKASGARIDFFLTRCAPSPAGGFFVTWKVSAPASSSSKLSSDAAIPPSALPFPFFLDLVFSGGMTIAGASSAPAPASSPSSSSVFLRRLPRLGIPNEPRFNTARQLPHDPDWILTKLGYK